MGNETDGILRVAKPTLMKSFRQVAKLCRPLTGEQAILSYDGACLHIQLGGMTVAMAAEGDWPGQCRVLGSFITTLAKIPPAENPVEFRVAGGLLHVSTSSFQCAWQTAWSAQIDLPMNVSLIGLLATRQRHTNEVIMQSGLSAAVKNAEVKRDRLIEKALKHLGAMGITAGDIRRLIDEKIDVAPD